MSLLRTFRALRLGAALLAALGLLLMPARQLLACPMLDDAEQVAGVEAAADEHAAHSGHEHGAPGEQSEEREGQLPEHERCPDLAHCAVAALSADAQALPAAVDLDVEAHPAIPRAPTSAHGALDTPPPKRG